jgi:hypothetical protein
VIKLYTASPGTGMTYVLPFDAAQRSLRAWAFATPSLQGQSPQRSEDAVSPEQSPLTCPGQCATEQESEGACLLLCLYMADRCDRNCAGCAVTASAEREGAPLAGKGTASASGRQCERNPDGNHGESNSTEGKSS